MGLNPGVLNVMKQRTYIPVRTMGLQQRALLSAEATAEMTLTDLDLKLAHDASAPANGTALYLAQERGRSQDGMLWSEMANAATVYIEEGTNAVRFPVIHKAVDELTLNVEHDGSADSNGTAVQVIPTGERTPWGAAVAILMSISANNADAVFQDADDVDSFTVYDLDGAATAGPLGLNWSAPVYIDEDASPATSRLLATNPTGNAEDMYVKGIGGHWLKITHHSDPGTPGVLLYFDDNAGTAHDRLLFISPTTTTMDDGGFGHHLGLWNVEGWWVGLIYADEDAANEYARLLCNIPAAEDGIVLAIDALRILEITYSADPGTPGVQVYIDDDVGALDDRLLFISPTTTSGTCQLSPRYKSLDDVTGEGIVLAADLALVSAGIGSAPLEEINSLGLMGLKMNTAANDVRHVMQVPSVWDRGQPINVRVHWCSAAAAVGDRTVTWKVLYGELTPDTTVLIAPATALDTAIAADVPIGTAFTYQISPTGVIDKNQIAKVAEEMSFLVEMDAKHVDHSEDIFLLGVEFEYTPKYGQEHSGGEPGEEWQA